MKTLKIYKKQKSAIKLQNYIIVCVINHSIKYFFVLFILEMQRRQEESSFEQEQSENIDLEVSDSNMNEDEQALFLDIRKSRSNDSFLGKLIGNTQDIEKRPLVLNMSQFCPQTLPSHPSQNGGSTFPPGMSIFKKVKKEKKHNKCDYQKNICGYITKKIIREFIGITFEDFTDQLCKKYYCSSDEARRFYLSKVENVTGPSHIPSLLQPQRNDSQQIIHCKYAFRQFFQWFLKERYLRYLLLQGKMSDKKAYIQFKNGVLFGFLEENKQQIDEEIRKYLQKKQEAKIQQEFNKIKSISSRSRSRDKNIILTQRIQ